MRQTTEETSFLSPKIEIPFSFFLVVKICVVRSCRNIIAFNNKGLGNFLLLILTVFIAHSYGIPSLILTVLGFHPVEFSTGTIELPRELDGESKVGIASCPPGAANAINWTFRLCHTSTPRG